MRLRSSLLALAVALAASLGAGCAPATSGAGDIGGDSTSSGSRVTVRVRNTVAPPTALTVYAVESGGGGSRRILGNVSPNGSATLSYSPSLSTGTYQLMGRTTGGQELVSTPFTVSAGQTVSWDVALNAIRIL